MQHKILLYPGGFKPFHDGHLKLLLSAIENNDIDEVYIITSEHARDNISAKSVFDNIIYAVKYKLLHQYNHSISLKYIVTKGSPIGECYNIINNDTTYAIYTVLCSNKSDIDESRNNKFYEEYKVGGIYNKDKWDYDKVFKLNIPNLPVTLFQNRCDQYDNTAISASVLRHDIYNVDWERFITGYRYMLLNRYTTADELYNMWNDTLET